MAVHTDPQLFIDTVAGRDHSRIIEKMDESYVSKVIAQIESDTLLLARAVAEIQALQAQVAQLTEQRDAAELNM